MKRQLLFIFLFFMSGFVGFSQSLTLSNSHGAVEPNAVIIQAGTPDSVELVTYLNVKNVGSTTLSVLCKKVQFSMLDSTEITMCWGGSCYPANVFVSPNPSVIAAGETNTEFIAHYTQVAYSHFKPGESVVRWTFFDRANMNDSVGVTVKYTSFPLGVEESNAHRATLSAAYPNPADKSASINYSVPSGSRGTIIIRNLVGTTIQTEQPFTGAGKMTINTSSLNDGLYFYSLVLDGKISQTKKLVVKH